MNAGNKFEAILLAAARARELKHQDNQTWTLTKNRGPTACVRAIQEVESGVITQEYFKRANTEN